MEEQCRTIDTSGRGALASVRSRAEKDHVSSMLKGRPGGSVEWVWVGGVRVADGPFYWYNEDQDGRINLHKLPEENFWKAYEPNGDNSGENCLQITSDGELVDYVCADQVTALCELRC